MWLVCGVFKPEFLRRFYDVFMSFCVGKYSEVLKARWRMPKNAKILYPTLFNGTFELRQSNSIKSMSKTQMLLLSLTYIHRTPGFPFSSDQNYKKEYREHRII